MSQGGIPSNIAALIDDPETEFTHICCVSEACDTATGTLLTDGEFEDVTADHATALASATILDAIDLLDASGAEMDTATFIETVLAEVKDRAETKEQVDSTD